MPARMPALKSPRLKFGRMWLLDDGAAGRVGERSLEAVADLDPNLALRGRHDQQRAGVLAFLPDAPMAAELIAEILDRKSLQRLERDHHDLLAGGALVLG